VIFLPLLFTVTAYLPSALRSVAYHCVAVRVQLVFAVSATVPFGYCVPRLLHTLPFRGSFYLQPAVVLFTFYVATITCVAF